MSLPSTSQLGDVRLDDGSCDALPSVALGRQWALHSRVMVSYRLVGAVYVLIVTEPQANVFLCLQLLDAVSKALVGVARGIDVTLEKLIKRYSELFGMIDGLLSGGMAALPTAFSHASATNEKLIVMPSSAADAARRLKRILGNKEGKESAFAVAAGMTKEEDYEPNGQPQQPSTPTAEELAQYNQSSLLSDPLAKISFEIPEDALPPPPPRAAGAKKRSRSPTRAIIPPPPPSAFAGAVKEKEEDESGMLKEGGEGEEENAVTLEEEEEEEEEEPVRAVVAPADVLQSLQFVEIWKAEVRGDTVKKAGTECLVRRRLAPMGVDSTRFKLAALKESPIIDACLLTAKMHPEHTLQEGQEFKAQLHGTSMECQYLKFTLPAISCPAPITVQLLVVPGTAGGRDRSWQGLAVLRYAVHPNALPGGLLDVNVDLDLAPDAGGDVVRISPEADWCRDECRVRWTLGTLKPGSEGALRVVLKAGKGAAPDRATTALKERTVARVSYSARPGKTLSGVTMEVSLPEADVGYMGGAVQHFGQIIVHPA